MAKIPTADTASTNAPAKSVPGRLLQERLSSGEVLLGGIVVEYLRPSIAKLYRQAGFDFVFFEYEHAMFDPNMLTATVLTARDNGLPVIAKTPQLERAAVAKLLESGIIGIQLPRTESREHVETLRSYIKFPPVGTRAVAPGFGSSDYRQAFEWKGWMDEQDEETTLVVHIETRLGYECAEEIVSTPGVDMVYVGPGDFSIEMGHPGKYDHPDVAGPMQEILELCLKHNVPFGTTPSGVKSAAKWAAMGARFFEAVDELSLIYSGASRLVSEYREACGCSR
ncbi:MAG: aldolase/citrate lyase family protein [Planctomycetota bacterium]|nr:aldolase/citrate lyase family protein [Planctomycetota bacterium]